MPAESPGFRINGLDLARAVAIAGMVLVNFQVVLANAADSGGGFSLLVDGITGRAAATWLSPFPAAGRMALTIYVAHVVVLLLWESTVAVPIQALVFLGARVAAAWLSSARFARGPLEHLLRRLSGSRS